MAYQIVPQISHPPYRVQGAQSAPKQLRLLEIPSLQSGQAPAALKVRARQSHVDRRRACGY